MQTITPIPPDYPTHMPISAPTGAPVDYRCQCCRSTDLQVEAIAEWDRTAQAWLVKWTSPAICRDCNSETTAVRRHRTSGAPITAADRFLSE